MRLESEHWKKPGGCWANGRERGLEMANILSLAGACEASRCLRERGLKKARYIIAVEIGEDWKREYGASTIERADKIFHAGYDHARIYELLPRGKRSLVDKR